MGRGTAAGGPGGNLQGTAEQGVIAAKPVRRLHLPGRSFASKWANSWGHRLSFHLGLPSTYLPLFAKSRQLLSITTTGPPGLSQPTAVSQVKGEWRFLRLSQAELSPGGHTSPALPTARCHRGSFHVQQKPKTPSPAQILRPRPVLDTIKGLFAHMEKRREISVKYSEDKQTWHSWAQEQEKEQGKESVD